MKPFLIKSSLFLALLLGTIALVFYKADGYSDEYYLRFTTPQQTSLILGTSKAAQGLKPTILNQLLNRNDIYNYAFSIRLSSFGPTYLESIRKKLKEKSNNGVFILSVDPWSIFVDSKTPEDPESLSENESFLNYMTPSGIKPNFSYLIRAYEQMYVKILYNKSLSFLHQDGWLEVKINNYQNKVTHEADKRVVYFDSLRHKRNVDSAIKRYLKKAKVYNYSNLRFEYLKKTIEFLKTKGKVYLVRLPVPESMLEMENTIMADFDIKINEVSNEFKVDYFDLTNLNSNCIFNDATHLNRESAAYVSKELAKMINQE